MDRDQRIEYKREKVEKYLVKFKDRLRLRRIESELSFPIGTIQKFTKKGRIIDDKRILLLYSYLKKMKL
ncbi:hypothetical protein [Aquimarina longa]|uniref:hypothetical protein n=1 Tax=Aquimarina longa TaxID=1080221 RepID=UPI000785AD09|nr:hypothetical protein [Aquimarina longa]